MAAHKIVHAADLHLDSPLLGLSRYDGAPVERIRGATRRALRNLVDLCIEEPAGALLIAGDLFDGDWQDYATGLFFLAELGRLRDAGTQVIVLRGNHDAESRISKKLRHPDHVTVLDHRKPQTVELADLGVAVHGQSFATAAVSQNLALDYPPPVAGAVNIGLLHTALEGREGHGRYAPCSERELIDRGYDYWALGHVHRREVLCQAPWIVFPGNLQGRHARETGPKGATLITIEDGRVTAVEPRTLDGVRWACLDVDATPLATADAVVQAVHEQLRSAAEQAEERLLAARVVVRGRSAAHAAFSHDPERWVSEIRAAAFDVPADVWIEKVRFDSRLPLDIDALRGQDDAIAALLGTLDAARHDPAQQAELRACLADVLRKLPSDVKRAPELAALDGGPGWAALLDEVEQQLVGALLEPGEPTS